MTGPSTRPGFSVLTMFRLPFGWTYGREYRRTLRSLRRSQWQDEAALRELQAERLRNLIRHAYDAVPYYRCMFDERGLAPEDIQNPADLRRLPLLTKRDVRENKADLVARDVPPRSLIEFATSGSTGQPLRFWGTKSLYKQEAAYVKRAYEAHGCRLNEESTAWLRRYVPSEGEPIWRWDRKWRRLFLSAYHLTRETVGRYVELIDGSGARTLSAYPSSAYVLALLLEETGLELQSVEAVHVASENVLQSWREKVERVMGVPVFAHYGMVERVAMFFQCPGSAAYHESPEYGVTEFLEDEYGRCQVVATGFMNCAMPFIRYVVGDCATLNEANARCSCGRGLPLSVRSFDGRANDILLTPDGRYVPGVNFYTMMHGIPGVGMFRIVQDRPSRVRVSVRPTDAFSEESMEKLEIGLRERLGRKMHVEIQLVDGIERDRDTEKVKCIENLCL